MFLSLITWLPVLLLLMLLPKHVRIQSVERNRLKSGACVKMRGSVSDVNAAMEVALEAAKPLGKVVSHTVIASPSEDTEIALKMTINK